MCMDKVSEYISSYSNGNPETFYFYERIVWEFEMESMEYKILQMDRSQTELTIAGIVLAKTSLAASFANNFLDSLTLLCFLDSNPT